MPLFAVCIVMEETAIGSQSNPSRPACTVSAPNVDPSVPRNKVAALLLPSEWIPCAMTLIIALQS